MDRAHCLHLSWLFTAVVFALGCSGGGSGGGTPPPQTCPTVAALQVVSTTPEDGQSGVSVQAVVTVRFNTCVDLQSVNATTVSLRRGVTAIPGSFSWDAAQSALVFEPAAALAYGAEYVFTVMGIRGVHGEALATPDLIVFETRSAPETVPPTTSASPPAGHYNTPQSVGLACVDNAGGTGCVGTFFSLDGSTPTPASPRYVAPIVVDRSLTLRFFSVDGDGNAEAPRSAEYVIDTDPPGVAATEPAAGATGVRLDAPIRVLFDEPMRASTLAGVPSVAPVAPGATAVEESLLAVVRQPSERYECATTYTATVPVTATDLAGNALPAPHVFTFTTSSDCDEPRTTASVASGAYASAQSVTLSCDDGAAGSGCARLVYTLDGSVPALSPQNGVVVAGAAAGPIAIGSGETVLRFRAEDAAGHLEVVRERRYSVSTQGFTWLATGWGLARGVGPVPERFVPVRSSGRTRQIFRDAASGRLYRVTDGAVVFSDGDATFHPLPIVPESGGSAVVPTSLAAQGSRIYAGTSDGLLVSTNGGASFRTHHFGFYDADRVRRVALSGRDVYVATDTALYASHDRFRTWALCRDEVVALAVDGETVYAVEPAGLAVSRDRGETWSVTALPASAGEGYAVAFDGDAVYVGTDGGVAVSPDRGATFARLLSFDPDGDPVTRVAAGDGRVYATTEVLFSTATSRFWMASSPSGPFTRRYVAGGTRDAPVSAIHVEGADVHVGGYPSYWLSHDHGDKFALADLPGNDVKRVVAKGAKVYAAIHDSSGFGGLVVSSDRGTTFTYRGVALATGLPDDSIDDLFVDGSTVYAGTWRGLAITTNDGETFNVRTEANSGLWQSTADAVWASGATVWAASTTKLQRSTNGGSSFLDRLTSVYPVELAVSGTNVYLATSDGVWVSNDGGATPFARRTTSDGLADAYVRDLDTLPDGALFVGTSSALDRSTDGGATFQRVTLPSGVSPYAVSACGGVLVVGGSTIGISTDGGATFAARSSSHGVPSSFADACYAAP
jgi:hypothetical protein